MMSFVCLFADVGMFAYCYGCLFTLFVVLLLLGWLVWFELLVLCLRWIESVGC